MQFAGFPRRFGSYVLLRPLARGGMGELFLAATGAPDMAKLCVLKKVLPNLLAADSAQRFREEAALVLRLSHGNLVGVFDAGTEGGELFLAMDFVEGRDLLATWNGCALKRVAFPLEIAVYVVKELARGLAYAHGYGDLKLVHRDVSPANVLLSYSGEVKLTDFGLATSRLKVQQTAPGIIYGKLGYLSPEQARGQPIDGRSDIYAAGILLWEMLTGQPLFPTKPALGTGTEAGAAGGAARGPQEPLSPVDALARIREPNILPPSRLTSRVPPELEAVVMKALAVNPKDRYQSGEELRAALGAFLARTAPDTDAATLASFMSHLFGDRIGPERQERAELLAGASSLLEERGRTGRRDADPAPTPAPTPVPASGGGEGGAAGQGNLAQRSAQAATATPNPSLGELLDNPERDPRIGTTLAGRYYLRSLCGQGAMGRVYEGQHIEIGRRVAVKILDATFRNTVDVVERFRREARAATKIGHPNIVDVTDSGTTPDGALFFVMEYLSGVDLEQLIERDGALPIERALLIAAQVCRALGAAHAAGIVHRDLKPANVMLIRHRDEEDFVKVLDFGISKHRDMDESGPGVTRALRLTRPDAAIGTPVYMSPEQVAGQAVDGRTDIYAVGGLLYEMLTGAPPYRGPDVVAVFNKKATEDPPPLRSYRVDIPAPVEAVVTTAMARRPEDRFATMAALKDAIVACLTDLQKAPAAGPAAAARLLPTAHPTWDMPTLTVRPRTVFGLSPGVLVGGFVAAVVVAIGLAFWPKMEPAVEVAAAPVPDTPSQKRAPEPRRDPRQSANTATTPLGDRPPASGGPSEPVGGPSSALGLIGPSAAAPMQSPNAQAQVAQAQLTSGRTAGRPRAGGQSHASGRRAPQPANTNRPDGEDARPASGEPPVFLDRARAAFAEGNFPTAARLARRAIAGSGGEGEKVEGHLLLGDTFFKLERFAEALAEYEAVLRLDPSNQRAARGRTLALARR